MGNRENREANKFFNSKRIWKTEADSGEKRHEGRAPLYFAITCFFFCNHFEELQTVLFEVELIINDAFLTLPKYYQNMFNIQSFVIWQALIIFF